MDAKKKNKTKTKKMPSYYGTAETAKPRKIVVKASKPPPKAPDQGQARQPSPFHGPIKTGSFHPFTNKKSGAR